MSIALVLLLSSAHAQEHKSIDFDFEEPPEGVGVGVILGDPSGLSLAFRSGEHHAVQMHFGYSAFHDRVHLSADYLYNLVILETPDMAGVRFPIYIGVGGRFQSYGSDLRNDGAGIGVRIPVGLALLPRSLAIDPFVELVPTILIVPETNAGLEGGVGIRLYF
jgi:hypothetical protein